MKHQVIWGVASIFAGVFTLWFNRRFPALGNDFTLTTFSGYFGGIVLIIVGIIMIIDALKG